MMYFVSDNSPHIFKELVIGYAYRYQDFIHLALKSLEIGEPEIANRAATGRNRLYLPPIHNPRRGFRTKIRGFRL